MQTIIGSASEKTKYLPELLKYSIKSLFFLKLLAVLSAITNGKYKKVLVPITKCQKSLHHMTTLFFSFFEKS